MVLAIGGLVMGQPTTEDRWQDMEAEKGTLLEERAVQIHPGELLGMTRDDRLNLRMLDVRPETDFNRFHILDAEHVDPDDIADLIPGYRLEPANTAFVLMSNDEAQATAIWKTMVAESVLNVYILEGGVNNWIATFADEDFKAANVLPNHADDTPAYSFAAALGSRQPMANPNPDVFTLEFTPKVKLEGKRGATSGGCG
jgi:hypothetical protein